MQLTSNNTDCSDWRRIFLPVTSHRAVEKLCCNSNNFPKKKKKTFLCLSNQKKSREKNAKTIFYITEPKRKFCVMFCVTLTHKKTDESINFCP